MPLTPAWLAVSVLSLALPATAGESVLVDRTAVRFTASALGGASNPRFISARLLSFEARLEQLHDEPGRLDEPLDERHVRTAVEHHVAEELLVRLPVESPPSAKGLARVAETMRRALESHVGGPAVLREAAARDGISSAELDELVYRIALSAMYMDRQFANVFRVGEEQLREAFQTTSHPFRDQSFEEHREEFTAFLALERARAAETAFVQGDRGRIVITFVER